MVRKPINKFLRFSNIGIQMALIIGLGTYAGVKLDEMYPNEHKVYTICFSLGSVFISLYNVIRQITKLSKDDEN